MLRRVMKSVISALVVLGLLATPIGCVLAACPAMQPGDDCCPKSSGLAICPYDILSTAKAAQGPQKHAVSAAVLIPQQITPIAEESSIFPIVSMAADGRDLHLQNRVLRI